MPKRKNPIVKVEPHIEASANKIKTDYKKVINTIGLFKLFESVKYQSISEINKLEQLLP